MGVRRLFGPHVRGAGGGRVGPGVKKSLNRSDTSLCHEVEMSETKASEEAEGVCLINSQQWQKAVAVMSVPEHEKEPMARSLARSFVSQVRRRRGRRTKELKLYTNSIPRTWN